MARSLTVERAERIRSQERAELAAHLHDSVLQTLALMQKRADDPREVAALARAQERELRAWLAGRSPAEGERSLAAALEAAAADVEQRHRVPVDVIAVGDADLDAAGEALVAATREAMVNAAKFGEGSPGRGLRRGDRRRAAGLRARSRPRLRSRDGPRGSPRAAGVRRGAHGAPRRARHGDRRARARAPRSSSTWTARHERPRVVVVDDHALFRSGVRAELEGRVDIVGDAASVAEAVEVIAAHEPDVVLLDVHLPDGSGADVIARDRAAAPGRPLPRAQRVRRRGGRHRRHPRRRPRLRHEVDRRRRPGRRGATASTTATRCSPRGSPGFVLDAFADSPVAPPAPVASEPDPDLEQLTAREREVLQHIARGYMYKEIAHRLGISTKTVEAHVSAVLRKLQLSNRHELSRWATTRRLVD